MSASERSVLPLTSKQCTGTTAVALAWVGISVLLIHMICCMEKLGGNQTYTLMLKTVDGIFGQAQKPVWKAELPVCHTAITAISRGNGDPTHCKRQGDASRPFSRRALGV